MATQNGSVQMDALSTSEPILARLEDFFASPAFTSALGDFMTEHAHTLEVSDVADEQPLHNMDVFCRYQAVVEGQLEDFIRSESLEPEEVYDACRRVKQGEDSAWITCVDYLLAATDYSNFMRLVLDFKGISQWDAAEGDAAPLEEYDYGITV